MSHPAPTESPRLLPLGDAAWTVELGRAISVPLNTRVRHLADRLAVIRTTDPLWAPVTDVVPTFRSLTIHFDPLRADAEALGQQLLALAQEDAAPVQTGRCWHLPVCFDPEFAPDLTHVAKSRHLSESEVVRDLLAATFHVHMIGFLPGFPYMGGLPPQLAMPRLASPRARVPAQSVAIAGEMCAVYPWDSPGGWNLLGRTAVPMFDPGEPEQPALLAAGDQVNWYAVSRNEHECLREQLQRGERSRATFMGTT